MTALTQTFSRFQSADRNTRLELLLDYARRLAPLPERYHAARDQGINRVPECQSEVFLWVEVNDGTVQLHADAPREAPTVRGFVSLLAKAMNGATPEEVAAVPNDLLEKLGLSDALGMMRMQGLTAIVGRVKRMVREAASPENRQEA
jgi:cysteine desulfuration protein SufE